MTHFAVRSLMNQASFQSKIDTDRQSYIKSVRIIKNVLLVIAAFPPLRYGKILKRRLSAKF
jgi:hypothetical protein